ncbi:MAG: hypothetical protein U1E26_08155 [Coriobacteriia bacterium]|nr:hypothetical protein [Coriobacteriia bacterium]
MSEKQSKAPQYLGLVGVIVFALYCLFVFIIFDVNDLEDATVFWMSFGFMCVAFLAQLAAPAFMARRAGLDAVFFGIPVIYLSVFYFFAELFASVVFMTFQGVGWKAALLVQAALLAIFVVAAIVSVVAQTEAQNISDERRVEATAFKAQYVDVQTMVDQCVDQSSGDLKSQLEHLSETIRYSDPFGRPDASISEVESRISAKTEALKGFCEASDTEAASGAVADLEKLYMERRRRLLLVK